MPFQYQDKPTLSEWRKDFLFIGEVVSKKNLGGFLLLPGKKKQDLQYFERWGGSKTSSHSSPDFLGRCEGVLRFMGREVQGRYKFRIQAVKWLIAKLEGDKTASFCREMSGREVTGR